MTMSTYTFISRPLIVVWGCVVAGMVAGPATAAASEVLIDDSASITVDEDRTLALRVVYKPGATPVPVIVLSHGTFSSGKKYDPVALYWAEHDYVVILPDHRDADYGEMPKSDAHMVEIIDSRARDMVAIVDQLQLIGTLIPDLHMRMDTTRLVSAGHSVGTFIAMQMVGLKVRNPVSGKLTAVNEDRYRAVVMLSDPGKMALMPDNVWLGGSRPALLVTGPDDYGLMGDGRRPADYQNEVLPAENPSVGQRYLLNIIGMDHQFGGLIKKQVATTEPDVEAMEVFLDISIAFLDVYVKGDETAMDRLEPRKISDRATLTVE